MGYCQLIGEDTQVNFGMHYVLRNPRSNSQKIPIYFSGLRWFFFCVTAFLRRTNTTDDHKYRLSRTNHYRVYASKLKSKFEGMYLSHNKLNKFLNFLWSWNEKTINANKKLKTYKSSDGSQANLILRKVCRTVELDRSIQIMMIDWICFYMWQIVCRHKDVKNDVLTVSKSLLSILPPSKNLSWT